MKKIFALFALIAGVVAANAQPVVTMSAMTSFAGDGWLAPGEGGNTWLDTANNTRGFAYNAATGNLVVVSRQGGLGIRTLNGTSGAVNGALAQGTGLIAGGAVLATQVGVADDGAIYMNNVSGTNYRVYRWANEAATPTLAFGGNSGLNRVGDAFDVIGSGANTRMITGSNGATGANGFAVLTTNDGASYSVNTITRTDDNMRLGITFGANANSYFGRETSSPMVVGGYSLPSTNIPGGTVALTSNGEAPMDFAVVNGFALLATVDVNSSLVRVYDVTTPNAPVLKFTATTTSGTLTGNTNSTGQVKWGAINGQNATLYAMSTNQGIQAFNVQVVPEPATMTALGLGLAALARRRKSAKK